MEELLSKTRKNIADTSSNSAIFNYREKALALFAKKGLPSKKNEDWKYTSIAPLFKENTSFHISHKKDQGEQKISDGEAIDLKKYVLDERSQIIFIDGNYCSQLTQLPEGLSLAYEHAPPPIEGKKLEACELYNLAANEKTLILTTEQNTVFKAPLTILHLKTPAISHQMIGPRIVVKVAKKAQLVVYESFRHIGKQNPHYTINSIIEFTLKKNAMAQHIKSQLDSLEALHIGTVKAYIEGGARFDSFTFSLGAKISRNNIHIVLAEEGAETNAHGLYALRGKQHSGQHSVIEHLKSYTQSAQLFKGVLDETSHGVFSGKIKVQKGTKQINSSQLNNNLLLNNLSHVNTRPILEINADDVKCAHGATIGQIDPEQVFYLESRGIEKSQALELLCHGFAQEAIDKIADDSIRRELSFLLVRKYDRYRQSSDASRGNQNERENFPC